VRDRVPLLPPGPDAPALLRGLGGLVDWAIIVIGATMILLVFCNVIFHVTGRDIAWTTELCEFLMVWVTFLGGAAAARRGLHMTITEFLDKLSPGGRRLADGAIQLLCLALLALLAWYGMGIVNATWGSELTVLHIPMAVQYLALPVGAAGMAVFVGWDVVQIARGRTRDQRYGP
jgi:TRAP-type C4-dicarboxylate transport system permease small subunit